MALQQSVLYRDGIPFAFLEGDSTRFLEPVEPEIENIARAALRGHGEPAAHLPRLRRLAQLEAARALADRRRYPLEGGRHVPSNADLFGSNDCLSG